jgi:hypothetical protein
MLLVINPVALGDAPVRVETAVTPALAVEIVTRPRRDAFDNLFAVRFKNVGPQPLRLLLPQDGVEMSWHVLCYRLTVRDGKGRALDMRLRYYLSDPQRDRKGLTESLVEIPPGQTHTMLFSVPQEVPARGTYRAVFEYEFGPFLAQVHDSKCPPGAWEGTVRSREVVLHLQAQH